MIGRNIRLFLGGLMAMAAAALSVPAYAMSEPWPLMPSFYGYSDHRDTLDLDAIIRTTDLDADRLLTDQARARTRSFRHRMNETSPASAVVGPVETSVVLA